MIVMLLSSSWTLLSLLLSCVLHSAFYYYWLLEFAVDAARFDIIKFIVINNVMIIGFTTIVDAATIITLAADYHHYAKFTFATMVVMIFIISASYLFLLIGDS